MYTYSEGTDGCDSTFDIYDPSGEHLVSVHFWDAREEAEDDAKLIVDALNAYKHTDPKRMTTEQLKQHVDDCYARHMYEEAADRGYDFFAANRAQNAWLNASVELKRRQGNGFLDVVAGITKLHDGAVAPGPQAGSTNIPSAEVLDRAAEKCHK